MDYLHSLLGPQEHIARMSRKHWLFILPGSVMYLLIAAAIVVAAILLSTVAGPLSLLVLILLVIPLYRLIAHWLDWLNSQYVVTDHRVIEVRGIFNKISADSSLDKVTDVVLTQSLMGRIMNYGDIKILTASEAGVNILRRISNPLQFKRDMLDQRHRLNDRRQTLD